MSQSANANVGIEDMFVTSVRYETKRLMQERRVPERNVVLHRYNDLLKHEVVLCVEVLCNGLEDRKEFHTTSEGRLPTTLSGFLKIWLHNKLARSRYTRWSLFVCGARLMHALSKYPSCPEVTHRHETWNVCPHGEHRRDCDRFLQFGSDFTTLNEEAKRYANDIVREAARLTEVGNMQESMDAMHRITRAAYMYKRVRGL